MTINNFDVLAPTYDSDFTISPIAQYVREKVHERLLGNFSAEQHLLELGCGTGEDALFLAKQGLQITATDLSTEMLAITQRKTEYTGRVTTQKLNLNDLPTKTSIDDRALFDGIYSNFGVVNCIHDRNKWIQWLSEQIKPNGVVALGIMSPLCVWEIGWHVAHLDFKIAFRRFKASTFRANPQAETITVYYPSPRQLIAEFSPFFTCTHIQPLGVFLPPTALYPVVEKRPRLFKTLLQLEYVFGKTSGLSILADHYWIEFRRRT